jgi:VanZ family protein
VPKNIFFLLVFFWAGIISFFCLVDSSELNKANINIENLDKIVHIIFHFVFTLLLYLFLKKQLNSSKNIQPLVISIIISIVFGLIIEVLQELCTTSRHADMFDVLANLFGASLFAGTITILGKFINLDRFLENKV